MTDQSMRRRKNFHFHRSELIGLFIAILSARAGVGHC